METPTHTGFFVPFFTFKSYYVVWKPQEKKEAKEGKVGLNRTM